MIKESLDNYLLQRGVDKNLHKFSIDYENDLVDFYISNLLGNLTSIQRHNRFAKSGHGNGELIPLKYFTITQKYLSYRKDKLVKTPKQVETFFGIESLNFSKEVYIVEGVFDACRVHSLRKSCLAVLGNDPYNNANALFFLRQKREVIALCDGDEASKNLKKFCHRSITLPNGTDANNFNKDELKEFLK